MLIFDFDGTLADSNGIWVEVDDIFLARRGLKATPEYNEMIGHSIFPIAAQLTRDYFHLDERTEDIMAEWLSLSREAYAAQVSLKPGAAEFLEKCAQAGEDMVLFTACVPELCQTALDRFGLTKYFQQLVYAQDLGLEKRDPRAFPLLLERLGVEGARCVLFDDSPAACRAAQAAGVAAVGVHDSFYAACEEEMRTFCDRYIMGFSELL